MSNLYTEKDLLPAYTEKGQLSPYTEKASLSTDTYEGHLPAYTEKGTAYAGIPLTARISRFSSLFSRTVRCRFSVCNNEPCNNPAYVDPQGTAAPFCSITCATVFLSRRDTFTFCANKKCVRKTYVEAETGQTHPFCSRACARTFANPKARRCSRPGCLVRVYTDPNNKKIRHSFCIKSCFWKECETLSVLKLKALKRNDADFVRLESFFEDFKVKKIVRIYMPQASTTPHLEYRRQLAAQSSIEEHQLVRQKFVGTLAACKPFCTISKGNLCRSGCAMCGIIQGRDLGKSILGRHPREVVENCAEDVPGCFGKNKALKVMFTFDLVGTVTTKNAAILPRFMIFFK